MDSFFLVQWTETNNTDLWFFVASYTKCLDLMNTLEHSEHSDFDHCIKKTVPKANFFIFDAPILQQISYSMENL